MELNFLRKPAHLLYKWDKEEFFAKGVTKVIECFQQNVSLKFLLTSTLYLNCYPQLSCRARICQLIDK